MLGVVTTPKTWRWREAVCRDDGISKLAIRTASAIIISADEKTASARVSRGMLAAMIGVTERSVNRAMAELVRRGHVEIDRGRPIGFKRDGSPVYGGGRRCATIKLVFRQAAE